MVLYEIHREAGGNGITFVHMLYSRNLYLIVFINKNIFSIKKHRLLNSNSKHKQTDTHVTKLEHISSLSQLRI